MLEALELYFLFVHVSNLIFTKKHIAGKFRHGKHSEITFVSLLLRV